MSDIMTADEVAEFLRLDRKTVYDYAGRGEIPCQRLGKRLLFSRRARVIVGVVQQALVGKQLIMSVRRETRWDGTWFYRKTVRNVSTRLRQ